MFVSDLLLNLDFMSVRMKYVFALRDTGQTGFEVSALNLNFLVCLVITETTCKIFLVTGDAILICNTNIVMIWKGLSYNYIVQNMIWRILEQK